MIRKDKPIDSNDMVRVKITQEIIISAKKNTSEASFHRAEQAKIWSDIGIKCKYTINKLTKT